MMEDKILMHRKLQEVIESLCSAYQGVIGMLTNAKQE